MSLTDIQSTPAEVDPPGVKSAERAFGFSLAFTGVRCILQYIVLPFILPLFGIAGDAAVPLLLAINVLAIISIFYTVRRFWQINYRYKWQYLLISIVMLGILTLFIVTDLYPTALGSL